MHSPFNRHEQRGGDSDRLRPNCWPFERLRPGLTKAAVTCLRSPSPPSLGTSVSLSAVNRISGSSGGGTGVAAVDGVVAAVDDVAEADTGPSPAFGRDGPSPGFGRDCRRHCVCCSCSRAYSLSRSRTVSRRLLRWRMSSSCLVRRSRRSVSSCCSFGGRG